MRRHVAPDHAKRRIWLIAKVLSGGLSACNCTGQIEREQEPSEIIK
jgi:hypothetical protein